MIKDAKVVSLCLSRHPANQHLRPLGHLAGGSLELHPCIFESPRLHRNIRWTVDILVYKIHRLRIQAGIAQDETLKSRPSPIGISEILLCLPGHRCKHRLYFFHECSATFNRAQW